MRIPFMEDLSDPRFHVVVPRRYAAIYMDVKEALRHLTGADVVLDRRFGERRRYSRPVAADRRNHLLDKRA